MKLFISYARVDKPLCKQIVERMSNVHDVWYDRRLHAGQAWWDEIVRQLHGSDGFVYLLSPDSVDSEYCQREFEIAAKLGKYLFPAVIRKAKGGNIAIPDSLKHIHYADLSEGMEQMYILMDALTVAERSLRTVSTISPPPTAANAQLPGSQITPGDAIGQAADAMNDEDYDKAVFILKQAQAKSPAGRIARMVETMLKEAEEALERQAYLREAEREYTPIAKLVNVERTRKLGCAEFADFHKNFPDYDPDHLANKCEGSGDGDATTAESVQKIIGAPFEWRDIPAGDVTIEYGDWEKQKNDEYKYIVKDKKIFQVAAFSIAKYPITNAQYQVFVDAKDGYADARWWDYSDDAKKWRAANAKPQDRAFSGDDHPRANVTWYESVAFCRWLTAKLGAASVGAVREPPLQIALPTEQQWQRAAQGDDGRMYPWGNDWDCKRCNNSVKPCDSNSTTPVRQYEGKDKGDSFFKVVDMAGNVWEWTRTEWEARSSGEGNLSGNRTRVLRGGSWYYLNIVDFRAAARDWDLPNLRYFLRGFRLARS